jgi:hypothetical protein
MVVLSLADPHIGISDVAPDMKDMVLQGCRCGNGSCVTGIEYMPALCETDMAGFGWPK